MGKNIKSYATFPQSISSRKGREALWQKCPNVQIFLFKYGTVLLYTFISKFTSKIFQLRFVLWHIPSELSRIHSIRPHTPRMMQNSHQLLTHLHYVSGTGPGRERSEIPANYAKSAQFAHIVCELREIRTIYLPII